MSVFRWVWWLIWRNDETGQSGQVESAEMDTQLQAQTNLEARMKDIPPNVGLPKGSYVVSYGVDMKRRK